MPVTGLHHQTAFSKKYQLENAVKGKLESILTYICQTEVQILTQVRGNNLSYLFTQSQEFLLFSRSTCCAVEHCSLS